MTDFLDLTNAYKFNCASGIVIILTQAVQWLTGWRPRWVGAVMSLLIATIGVLENHTKSLPWYNYFFEVLLRACQLFVYCGTLTGFITKGWRTHRAKKGKRSLTKPVGGPSRPFWIPWFWSIHRLDNCWPKSKNPGLNWLFKPAAKSLPPFSLILSIR